MRTRIDANDLEKELREAVKLLWRHLAFIGPRSFPKDILEDLKKDTLDFLEKYAE